MVRDLPEDIQDVFHGSRRRYQGKWPDPYELAELFQDW